VTFRGEGIIPMEKIVTADDAHQTREKSTTARESSEQHHTALKVPTSKCLVALLAKEDISVEWLRFGNGIRRRGEGGGSSSGGGDAAAGRRRWKFGWECRYQKTEMEDEVTGRREARVRERGECQLRPDGWRETCLWGMTHAHLLAFFQIKVHHNPSTHPWRCRTQRRGR